MNTDDNLEQRLHTLARPGLSPARRAAIWRMAQRKAQVAAQPVPMGFWRKPGFRLALALAMMMVCVWSAGWGSALPGAPLYGVRREAETIVLALTPVSAQGALRLELLDRRTHELARLIETRRPVPSALLNDIETSFWTLSTYPQLWGVQPGQVLAYVERNRQTYLDLTYRYPNLQAPLRLLTVSSVARDRLWDGSSAE